MKIRVVLNQIHTFVSGLIVLTFFHCKSGNAQIYSISVITNPSGCFGGQPCLTQPSIAVLNSLSQIDYSYSGSAFAQIGTSPTGYEALYYGQSCTAKRCEQQVVGSLATVPIVDGIANFQNLYFKEAGTGYTLNFIAVTSTGSQFAECTSSSFSVHVGNFSRLSFNTPIGNSFGGIPFNSNPTIAFVDKGNNVVSDIQNIPVTVSLNVFPSNQNVSLLPIGATTVIASNGLAEFQYFYINPSGYPYQLLFTAELNGINSVTSNFFAVNVGKPARLSFVPEFDLTIGSYNNSSSNSSLLQHSYYSGEFFTIPPQLSIQDAGGNVITHDSSSAVEVSILSNPSRYGGIGPKSSLFVVANNGIVSFNGIKIQKPGVGYRLKFQLYNYSSLIHQFSSTDITIISKEFTVLLGLPRKLHVRVPADDAWAGGQPFNVQPVVDVTDYSGNIITTDKSSVVSVSMVSSLAATTFNNEFISSAQDDFANFRRIVVDTTHAPPTTITNLTIDLQDGHLYTAGDLVQIRVWFSFPISLFINKLPIKHIDLVTMGQSYGPYLKLNLKNYSSDLPENYPRKAYLTGTTERTFSLLFLYRILPGDIATPEFGNSSSYLAIELSRTGQAIFLNHSVLMDGADRILNTTLPDNSKISLSFDKKMIVDTRPAFITSIDTNLPNGEYGAGQEILIYFTFNVPVVVVGTPFIRLLFEWYGGATSIVTANYTTSSSDHFNQTGNVVTFRYIVNPGDLALSLTIASSAIDLYENISLYNFTGKYSSSEPFQWNATNAESGYVFIDSKILSQSDMPTVSSNLVISPRLSSNFTNNHAIVIDTSAPKINTFYGMQTNHANGIFFPGELIPIFMQFDKPVVTFGDGIFILLDCGPQVINGRLQYEGKAYIKTISSDNLTIEFEYFVEKNVNSSALNIKTGATSMIISEKGAYIRRQSTFPIQDADIGTADVIPSGNSLGDQYNIGVFGFTPTITSVFVESTSPSTATTLYPDDYAFIQVTFSIPLVANCLPVFVIVLAPAVGKAGAQSREASYYSGNNSNQFIFKYTVQTGDSSNYGIRYRLNPSALCVTTGCPNPHKSSCYLRAMAIPSPTLDLYDKLEYQKPLIYGGLLALPITNSRNITIYPVSASRNTTIIKVLTLTNPTGLYGVGSAVTYSAIISDAVIVNIASQDSSLHPRLYLNTGRYASYSGGSGSNTLKFTYIVHQTDADYLTQTNGNTLLLPTSIQCNQVSHKGVCYLHNQAGLPVDNTLTADALQSLSSIEIDSVIPTITRIWSDKPTSPFDGIYSVGEKFRILVEVNRPVVVVGFNPRILMAVVNHTKPQGSGVNSTNNTLPSDISAHRYALYDPVQTRLYYNRSNSVFTDKTVGNSNFTSYQEQQFLSAFGVGGYSVLVFIYEAVPGDYTTNLTYVCSVLLGCMLDLQNGNSAIYRYSTIPQVSLLNANLPNPALPLAIAGQTIAINTNIVPYITKVQLVKSIPSNEYSSLNFKRRKFFAAGDSIVIRVDFSHYIIASGHSHLTINAGEQTSIAPLIGYSPFYNGSESDPTYSHDFQIYVNREDNSSDWVPLQWNTPSTPTKHLFYNYTVQLGHSSSCLDYLDPFSLFVDFNDDGTDGYIKSAIFVGDLHQLSDANLVLPIPGGVGSLCPSDNLNSESIVNYVDGGSPQLTSVEYVSQSGRYDTNQTILIAMKFSAKVDVVGCCPFILLEVGGSSSSVSELYESDRGKAMYINGSESSILIFAYSPQPGDSTTALDYYSSRSNLRNAFQAFYYNGARICSHSQNPIADVLIHLNPPSGKLFGTTTAEVYQGRSAFQDVGISFRGANYQLRYQSVVSATFSGKNQSINDSFAILQASQPLFVSFSSEFQLRPKESMPNYLNGYAVDMYGDLAVMGSPNANRSVTSIQTVTTMSVQVDPQNEVQIIETYIKPQPAIFQFYTNANVGVTIGGTFRTSYGVYGPTESIPANVDADMLVAIFKFDLPEAGAVSVTRSPYIYCACENAFLWTITFLDLTEGVAESLSFDTTDLTGEGASIDGAVYLQYPALLDGTFTLSFIGKNSSPIPFDASVAELTEAIEGLGLTVENVLISSANLALARQWSVTFGPYNSFYEIPQLIADGSGLTGGVTEIFTQISQIGVNGPEGINGHFQLIWRGNTTSDLLPNTTATDMKEALEALPVINFVNVNRSNGDGKGGYTWTIEFVSVNLFTPQGYVQQDTSNMEPLQYINNLIATNASILINSRSGSGSPIRAYDSVREGTFGAGAGYVYIFQRFNETWGQVASITSNDSTTGTRFGFSVSVFEDTILIGAIGANRDGVPEKQAISCSATGGYFRIKFRGWETSPISYNVTNQELIDAIVSTPSVFSNLYTIFAIDIDDWGTGGLCSSNKTAIMTFYSPTNGDTLLEGSDTGANLELLTLVNLNLTSNFTVHLSIRELQKGTRVVPGVSADLQQIGAAYVFRSSRYDCDEAIGLNFSSDLCIRNEWLQEAELFPTTSIVNSLFGQSVALSSTLAVIGAPGSLSNQGCVYICEFVPASTSSTRSNAWIYLQLLRDPYVTSNDLFGTTVAIYGNTVVVGAPGYQDNQGLIHVFKRSSSGIGSFVAAQSLLPPSAQYPLSAYAMYGSSVAIDQNTIAVGCPGYEDLQDTLTSGEVVKREGGSVFVFTRTGTDYGFSFQSVLNPTNVQSGDRFGHSVDVNENNLIVSSFQVFDGDLNASKSIVSITTQAADGHTPLGGSFRLRWTNSPDGEFFETRLIPYNATAKDMKIIIEYDLLNPAKGVLNGGGNGSPGTDYGNNGQQILVSRSLVDLYSGGYTWLVTFLEDTRGLGSTLNGYTGGGELSTTASLFTPDLTDLLGANATIQISYLNLVPQTKFRTKVHYFQRNEIAEKFVEQVFISPHRYESLDRCGMSVALDGDYSLVGCPNRDLRVPNQNSGAGYIYDMLLLGLAFAKIDNHSLWWPSVDNYNTTFSSNSSSVREGYSAEVVIRHGVTSSNDIPFYLQTLDRNSNYRVQSFFQDLYDVFVSQLDYPNTILDYLGITGKAIGRSQFYGSSSRASKWLNGLFDYRAISDYVPLYSPQILLTEQMDIRTTITTNLDSILEKPNEKITVAIHSPGLWPSTLGRLYTSITIEDYIEGQASGQLQYDKVYQADNLDPTPQTFQTVSPLGSQGSALDLSSTLTQEFGSSVAIDNDMGVMFIGAPKGSSDGHSNQEGKVIMFKAQSNRTWIQHQSFTSPYYYNAMNSSSLFGDEVVVSTLYNRTVSFLAIGEPGVNKIHMYISEGSTFGIDYTFEQTLSVSEAYLPQHLFGQHGSISINGYLLVAGAMGLDAVYVFRRLYNNGTGLWRWNEGEKVVSEDHNYNLINGVQFTHMQGFGAGVAVSGRTMVIGSPYADYDPLGLPNLVGQDYNTEGSSITSYGKGKAYVFSSIPTEQLIRITATQPLSQGEFQLSFSSEGIVQTTERLSFYSTADEIKIALESLQNIDEVQVSNPSPNRTEIVDANNKASLQGAFEPIYTPEAIEAIGYQYTWIVTFVSSWDNQISLLTPLWYGFGCSSCLNFSYPAPTYLAGSPSPEISIQGVATGYNQAVSNIEEAQKHQMEVSLNVKSNGIFEQMQALQASDPRIGDRFGNAVDIDGNQIIVGAPYSATATTTTWDFETGTLRGWRSTGGFAFNFQPTFGDNPRFRLSVEDLNVIATRNLSANNLHRANSQSNVMSGLVGNYYIGTFEKRPGDPTDYSLPNREYAAGNVQGGGPVGVLSSEVFMIRGNKISFLIGGGCDVSKVYVKLLIDGIEVARETGKCLEKMQWASFPNLDVYNGRAAQLRIVDNSSSSLWGHINVDQFKFDWDVEGAKIPVQSSSAATQKTLFDAVTSRTDSSTRTVAGGVIETPLSGAAYVYRRYSRQPSMLPFYQTVKPCDAKVQNCIWVEETKLVASDKRSNDYFGSSVKIQESSGLAIVGCPYSSVRGFYKEVPTVYPYNEAQRSPPTTLSLNDHNSSAITVGTYTSIAESTTYLMSCADYSDTSTIVAPAGLCYPVPATDLPIFESNLNLMPLASGAKGVWELQRQAQVSPDASLFEQGGAIYIYRKFQEKYTYNDEIVNVEWWTPIEHAKIQPPDELGGDHFGSALDVGTSFIGIGAPGHDIMGDSNGAVYVYNLAFAAVSFSQAEYIALEGIEPFVSISLYRDVAVYAGDIYLEYATSDLTAQGVDKTKFDECIQLPPIDRGHPIYNESDTEWMLPNNWAGSRRRATVCGDYQQSSGTVVIRQGDVTGTFTINIMNDECYEPWTKYVQLTLSVPGSAAIQGERYSAKISIQDDDFGKPRC